MLSLQHTDLLLFKRSGGHRHAHRCSGFEFHADLHDPEEGHIQQDEWLRHTCCFFVLSWNKQAISSVILS